MSNLFKYTKRVLTSVLAAAVVLTAIPSTAFGAELPDEDFVEAVEVQEAEVADEAVVEEEAAATDGTGNEEEVIIEGEEETPDQAKSDVKITFDASTAAGTLNAAIRTSDFDLVTTYNNDSLYTDSEKDFVFMVTPADGLAFNLKDEEGKDKALLKGYYMDYTEDPDFGNKKQVNSSVFTVSDPSEAEIAEYGRGTKKISVPKATLASVVSTKQKGAGAAEPELVITFTETATPAEWQLSGFDLTDIKEKSKYAPSVKTLINDTNKTITLSDALVIGSLDVTTFGVRVSAYDQNDKFVLSSELLANGSSLSGDASDVDRWVTDRHPADTDHDVYWACYYGGVVTIAGAAISYFYANNYKVYVEVDASAGLVTTVNVKASADSLTQATITEIAAGDLLANEASGDITATAGADFDTTGTDTKFVFDVANVAPYAYVHSVTWTIDGKSDDSYDAQVPAKTTTKKISIPKSDLEGGNAVVTVKGAYKVEKQGGSTAYVIYDKDGDEIEQVESGKGLEFKIAPADGKKVTGVKYYVGADTTPLEPTTDTTTGYYTIASNKITGNITINPTITSTGVDTEVGVKTAGNYGTDVVVTRLDNVGTTIDSTNTMMKQGDPLLFIVTPNTGFEVEEVSYTMGSQKDVVLTPYGETYKIPSLTDNTTIKVVYKAAHKVYAPTNKNVTVDFAEAGDYTTAADGAFTFTVTPANSNVKVTGVWANTTESKGGTTLTKTGGTFTLGADTHIYVETEESIDPTGFRAVYHNNTAAGNKGIDIKYETGKPKTPLYITEQTLKLVKGDAAQEITADFYPVKDGKLRNAFVWKNTDPPSGDGSYSVTAPESSEIIAITEVPDAGDAENVAETVEIEAKKVGNEDVTVTWKKPDADNTGNSFVYPGVLKVSVTQPYTDINIKADKDTAYVYSGAADSNKLDIVKLDLVGKDGQTGKEASVTTASGEVKNIAWSFVPSMAQTKPADYKHAFVVGDSASAPTGGDDGRLYTNASTTYVCSTKTESVTVQAIVTFKDNSEETFTKTLTFIDPLTESYFMTRSISGAADDFDVFLAAGTPAAYAHDTSIDLGLNVPDLKEVTVKYDIYKLVKKHGTVDYDSKEEIEDLLKKGDIVKVENATLGEAKIKNMFYDNSAGTTVEDLNDKNVYATVDPSGASFKISAAKVTRIAADPADDNYVEFNAPSVTIDSIKIPNLNFANRNVTFKVVSEVVRNKVDLITLDDQTAESGELVYEVQTLSDAFIANRDYSKISKKVDGTTKQIGIEFTTIGNGIDFRLPTESDFTTKPCAKKMLLGWVETTYPTAPALEGTIVPADTGVATIIAPGTFVPVAANVGYKAIWYDRYAAICPMDATRTYVDDDNVVQYPVPVGVDDIRIGSVIPTTMAAVKVVGPQSGNNKALTITGLVVNPAKLDTDVEYYTGGFTLTAKDANAKDALDDAKIKTGTIATNDNATDGELVTVTAAWTDPNRKDKTDVYKDDFAYTLVTGPTSSVAFTGIAISADNKADMEESGVPATLTANLTDGVAITLHNEKDSSSSWTPGDGNAYWYNYAFKWSSSDSTVAKLEVGEKENQGIATLTPLKAGKSTIKVEVTQSGKKIAEKSFELTVAASDVVLVFADATGKTGITQVLAQAGDDGTINANILKVKATNKAGKAITGGSFSFGASGSYNTNKVIANGQPSVPVSGTGDASGFTNLTITTKDFVGTDKLHVVYTATISGESHKYQKDIDVKSYYAVTLTPPADTWITVDGQKQYAADGKSPTPVEIRLTEDDMKNVTETDYSKANPINKKDFNFVNVSLDGYSAVYKDNTKTFSNWTVNTITKANPNDTAKTYKENETISKLIGYEDGTGHTVDTNKSKSNFEAGKGVYPLVATMADKVTLTGVPGEITMDYSTTPANNTKTVSITIDPDTYVTPLVVTGEKTGFYSVYNADTTNGDKIPANVNKTSTPAGGKAKFAINAYSFTAVPDDTASNRVIVAYDPTDKETWRAGSDVLGIYTATSMKPAATINLYINGLNYDTSSQKVQCYENGQIVKSDYRTINGNTYYFDAEGNWIETTGITKINGKSVLIIDGVVAPKGKRVFDGNTYFVGDNGVIQTGWLTAEGAAATSANGVYYADPAADGKLVTGVQTIDGKKFVFGPDNKVSRASSAAKDYELINGFYVNAAGEIAENGLFKVDNINRLFRADGSIVSYGDPDVKDGKIKQGNITYVIDKITSEAKPDKKMVNAKFEWTTSKPSKWELSNPLPTSDWKVTYNLEGESEKLYANGTVTATASPADYKTLVGVTEVTFTFAVPDLSGYYSDAKGTTALTADPAVWKYKFKGSTGLGEGISVEGLTDGDEFDYTGYAIKPSFKVVDNETGATLVEKTDYTLKWTGNNPKATALPATATVTITGKGNYDKSTITRTFKIVDPTAGEDPATYSAVKSVKVEKETITYDGTEKFPKTLTITLADKSKVTATWNGSDYDLSPDTANVKIIVSNNINKGKGNVTVYGSDFKKPAKTTFTIAAADVASLGDKLTVEPEAPVYTKSGAKAKVTVKFNGDELVEGRDYKLNFKYSNKKNAGTAAGSVYITGKNNFKGSTKNTPVSFDIQKLTISDENVIVDAYAGVAPKSIKAKVYDSEGNEIAKTNYTIKVEKDGIDISTSSTKLVAGDEITVTVAGAAGSNADEETKAEIDITIRTKLSSAKFNAKGLQKEFNGSEVTLDSTDMAKVTATVKINKVDTTLEYGTDYEIVSYKNNTKKGTMTVFVRAKDSSEKVSGFGSFKVKIVPKPVKDADK